MKIKNSPLLHLSIPGYKFINVISLTNAREVGVYVSEAFHYEIITFYFQFSGSEQWWIHINCLNSTLFMLSVLFIVFLPPKVILLSF